MNLINTLIVWAWLLGISLLIPTSLPAGGSQRAVIQSRENSISSPLIALEEFNLLSTINGDRPVLSDIKAGTPVQVLKVWDSPKNGKWLLVNVLSQSSYQLFQKRGWVNIGIF